MKPLLLPTGPGIEALATGVTWPNEEQDIADMIKVIASPLTPPATADRLLRALLSIAKVAAFGAGTQHGFSLGEKLANSVLEEARRIVAEAERARATIQ